MDPRQIKEEQYDISQFAIFTNSSHYFPDLDSIFNIESSKKKDEEYLNLNDFNQHAKITHLQSILDSHLETVLHQESGLTVPAKDKYTPKELLEIKRFKETLAHYQKEFMSRWHELRLERNLIKTIQSSTSKSSLIYNTKLDRAFKDYVFHTFGDFTIKELEYDLLSQLQKSLLQIDAEKLAIHLQIFLSKWLESDAPLRDLSDLKKEFRESLSTLIPDHFILSLAKPEEKLQNDTVKTTKSVINLPSPPQKVHEPLKSKNSIHHIQTPDPTPFKTTREFDQSKHWIELKTFSNHTIDDPDSILNFTIFSKDSRPKNSDTEVKPKVKYRSQILSF